MQARSSLGLCCLPSSSGSSSSPPAKPPFRPMESDTATPIAAPPPAISGGGSAYAVSKLVQRLAVAGSVELGDGDDYSCKHCRTHLALAADVISKRFYCKSGKAYLFDNVVNVRVGEKEDRMLITGMHSISDIFCAGCEAIVGWKYEAAYEETQKYKEGKYILERDQMLGPE